MHYHTLEKENELLVDERFDGIYSQQRKGNSPVEYALKKLDHTTEKCSKELNSDVFFFKEDLDDDYDLIQPVSDIITHKMTNVYIPMISPILEEQEEDDDDDESEEDDDDDESEEDEPTTSIEEHQDNSYPFSINDYKLDLVAYYKDMIRATMNRATVQSTLPNDYIQFIENTDF